MPGAYGRGGARACRRYGSRPAAGPAVGPGPRGPSGVAPRPAWRQSAGRRCGHVAAKRCAADCGRTACVLISSPAPTECICAASVLRWISSGLPPAAGSWTRPERVPSSSCGPVWRWLVRYRRDRAPGAFAHTYSPGPPGFGQDPLSPPKLGGEAPAVISHRQRVDGQARSASRSAPPRSAPGSGIRAPAGRSGPAAPGRRVPSRSPPAGGTERARFGHGDDPCLALGSFLRRSAL